VLSNKLNLIEIKTHKQQNPVAAKLLGCPDLPTTSRVGKGGAMAEQKRKTKMMEWKRSPSL